MSEQIPHQSPADELPPTQAAESLNDSLSEFSGKYVAIALFVGLVLFYLENGDLFLPAIAFAPETLLLALAKGMIVTITAMALYGRWNGKPFFESRVIG